MMYEYSVSTSVYEEYPLEQVCEELSTIDVDHLELWQVKGWCEHLERGPETAAETADRYDMEPYALAAYYADLDELDQFIADLDSLGGSVLVKEPPGPDVNIETFADQLRPIVKTAADHGVTVGVENHVESCLESIESMVRLLDRLPDEGIGITLAPSHLYRTGHSIPEAIRTIGDDVAFFYARDWGPETDPEENPEDQFVGAGELDFHEILRALDDVGYDHPINTFAHGTAHWPAEKTTRHLAEGLENLKRIVNDVSN